MPACHQPLPTDRAHTHPQLETQRDLVAQQGRLIERLGNPSSDTGQYPDPHLCVTQTPHLCMIRGPLTALLPAVHQSCSHGGRWSHKARKVSG